MEKRQADLAKHGVDFSALGFFEWETAVDDRHDEPRWVAIGFIGLQLHVVVYTVRNRAVRVISLRKATPQERMRYAKT